VARNQDLWSEAKLHSKIEIPCEAPLKTPAAARRLGAGRGRGKDEGLCSEKKVSGGKVLYTKSRRVRSRVASALRLGAHSLHHAKDYLGEFFRRITRRLGKPQAITATAHKLARIVYHLLNTKQAYDENVFHRCEEETLRRAELRLRRHAPQLGFQVIPAANG
jgi:transposase